VQITSKGTFFIPTSNPLVFKNTFLCGMKIFLEISTDTQNQQIMKFITDNHNEIRFSSDKEEYQLKSIT